MALIRIALRIILLGLFSGSLALAQTPNFDAAIASSRAFVQTNIAAKVPGCSVAVAVDGKLVWSEAFGFADLAAKKPAITTTRFRIGSISKSLTSAGLGLLIERRQINIDAPIQTYLPDFPQKEAPLTVRLIGGHLGGIRNYKLHEALSDKPYSNLQSGLKIFADDPLEALPGTKFIYSSYNWNLIGAIMEVAAKQDFLTFMQENVLNPLHLTNTVPDRVGVPDPQRTAFYEMDGEGKFITAPEVDNSYKWPSGGYLSTSEDLVHFGTMMMAQNFLNADTRRTLFTTQHAIGGKATRYGLGWMSGRTTLYHEGDSVGGSGILLLVPATKTVVAILCNRGHVMITEADGKPKYAPIPLEKNFNREISAFTIAKAFSPTNSPPLHYNVEPLQKK